MRCSDQVLAQCHEISELLGKPALPCIPNPPPGSSTASQIKARYPDDHIAIFRCLRVALESQSEYCEAHGRGEFIFAIPLESNDYLPWFAVGQLSATSLLDAMRLLRAAGNSARLRAQILLQQDAMEAASNHMSQVMREQAWLRDLAAQTRLEQSRLGIDNLSKSIFEPLCRVINAEAVGILVSTPNDAHPLQIRTQIHSHHGWRVEDMSELLGLVIKPEFGEVSTLDGLCVTTSQGIIRSAMISRINQAEEFQVHLIAINRIPDANQNRSSFGNHERGLFHEAAFYLESHSSNLQLLMESEQLVLGTLQAMSQAIEARDPYTRGHSDRVAKLAFQLAKACNLPETACQEILIAGVLHDVGKIGVPDHVLSKPGKLTEEERELIQRHPEIGHGILEKLGKLRFALPGVLYHHERWDGKGYPHRLAGENIPLMARILAVVDSFDAMTSSRPYRVGMRIETTRQIMLEGAGSQWDPNLIPIFIQWLDSTQFSSQAPGSIQSIIQNTDKNDSGVLQAVSMLQL